jgi:hypothetical protein
MPVSALADIIVCGVGRRQVTPLAVPCSIDRLQT